MTTLFPGAIDSYSLKVDGVTDVLAAHVNDLQDAVVAIETAVIATSPNPNLLNDTLSHDLWLGGTTFNDFADDSYVGGTLWNGLHNGQTPDASGDATVAVGQSKRPLKCLFDSAASQAGFVQFLINEDAVHLRGKTLSFSIDTATLNIPNMRCAILEWVGTADAITSDVVATWGAGNPTLATNWAYIGTPADQAISGTTRIKAEGKVIGATTTNLAVFVWCPAEEASTDYFRLANAKLEIGLSSTPFVAPSFVEELSLISYLYNKSYSLATAPGTATNVNMLTYQTRRTVAASTAGTPLVETISYPRMRTTPTIVIYSNNTGTANAIHNASVPGDRGGCTASGVGDTRFGSIAADNSSATAIAADNALQFHFVADARL